MQRRDFFKTTIGLALATAAGKLGTKQTAKVIPTSDPTANFDCKLLTISTIEHHSEWHSVIGTKMKIDRLTITGRNQFDEIEVVTLPVEKL